MERKLFKDEVALMSPETRMIFNRFTNAGKEVYLVGAGVRAILKGSRPVNCDFTTNATPEETQEIFKDLDPFYDNPFGMVGIPIERNQESGIKNLEVYEITTYRTEQGYSDSRRPDKVEWGHTLKEDVVRRDFTMNAMVIGLKQKEVDTKKPIRLAQGEQEFVLIDYLGGVEDFEMGVIKSVGPADERFKEDALRMMRAIRFAAQLSFRIEPKTMEAVTKNAALLEKISWERKRDELLKILKSDHAADGVHLLVTTGLMRYIIPEVLEGRGVSQTGHHTLDVYTHMLEALRNSPSSDPLLRLTTFLHDVGKPKSRRLRCGKCKAFMHSDDLESAGPTAKMTMYKCPKCQTVQTEHEAATFYGHEVIGARMVKEIGERLRLPRKDVEKMVTLVRWHMFAYQPSMTDASIRRFIRRVGKENIDDMIALRIGDRKGGGSTTTSWRLIELQHRVMEQLWEPLSINDLVIDGNDIMKILKIPPGRKIGEILKQLFSEVEKDTSLNTEEYLTKRVQELA